MSEGLLLRRLGFLLAVILVSITVGAPSQCAQKSSDAQATPKAKSLDDAMKAMFDVRGRSQRARRKNAHYSRRWQNSVRGT